MEVSNAGSTKVNATFESEDGRAIRKGQECQSRIVKDDEGSEMLLRVRNFPGTSMPGVVPRPSGISLFRAVRFCGVRSHATHVVETYWSTEDDTSTMSTTPPAATSLVTLNVLPEHYPFERSLATVFDED